MNASNFRHLRVSRNILSGVASVLILSGVMTTVGAATVGYWRFESGNVTGDSSGNGLTLTATTGTPYSGPVNSALGTSGQGAFFPTTIAQTGASNGSMAQGPGASQSWGNNVYYVADTAALAPTSAMTIESFVNLSSSVNGVNRVIAGQGANANSGAGVGAWAMTVTAEDNTNRGARNVLFQWLPSGTWAGGSLMTVDSNIQLTVGHDYYLACAVDFASGAAGGIVFYYQDLTLGGSLQTISLQHTASTIVDSPFPLTIGSADAGFLNWAGAIDEVRLSNTQLGVNELLIVPEPSSVALAAVGLMGLFVLVRTPKARRS